jgi:hypothetical protein
MKVPFLSAAAVLLISGSVMAHPGHGEPEVSDGLMHYVSSPLHFVPLVCGVLLVAVAVAGIRTLRRRSTQDIRSDSDRR